MRSYRDQWEWVSVFVENRPAVLGAVILMLLGAASLFAPLLTPYDPLRGVASAVQPPQIAHPFGTDDLGRDIASQVLFGLRVSFFVGMSSTVVAVLIGIAVGGVAGFAGGLLDDLLMRVTEMFQVIPRFFLAILLVASFGQRLEVTASAIAVLSWPPLARVVRAEFLSKREAEYVLAARAVGASRLHIAFREILPNALGPVVVTASLSVGVAILIESGLAFIGLSDPSLISLGRNLQFAIRYMQTAWWMSLFPGAALLLLILGFNLVGEGATDVLNRRLRQ